MFKPIVFAAATVLLATAAVGAQSATQPSSNSNSQSREKSNNPHMDQILVTAARTPLSLARAGNAVTVITRDEIERRQLRYVSDLLRSVPGFSVSQSGVAGSQTQVRVRGAEANHTLVLVDGVRANDAATGDEFRWELLTTGNIERIEIVRGAQSALWGSDAVGAVVQIFTHGERDGSRLDAWAEGGSNSTGNFGFNGGVDGSRWSLSGALERLDTGGGNIARTGGEDDQADALTGSLNFDFNATEALRLNAGLQAVEAYSQVDPVGAGGLPVDDDIATKGSNRYARIGGVLDAGRVRHHLKIHYFDSDNRYLTHGVKDSSSASTRSSFAYQSDVDFGSNRLSLALEHERTDFQQRGEVGFGDPNQDQKLDATSLVAEYQGLAGTRLSWLASVRHDDNSDFEDSVSGRLSLAWRLSDATRLRTSIGSGHKNPTFTERFGYYSREFVGNPELEPEHSISYDIGIDSELRNGTLLVQASLFRQDLEDEIDGFVFDPVSFLFTAENRDGASQRKGVELSASWQVRPWLDLGAAYTFTDATERNAAGENVTELRRPRHAGSLNAGLRSSDGRISASLVADYGGDSKDIFFPPWPEPSAIVTLDSFWLLDLSVQYRLTPAVWLFAKSTNLLDENYEQVYGYRTLGRAAYVGLRTRF